MGQLIPIELHLNAYRLCIVTVYVPSFMATIYPYYSSCFQHDNVSYHKAQILLNSFHENNNDLSAFQWPPRSPALNPIVHLWKVKKLEICNMNRVLYILGLCNPGWFESLIYLFIFINHSLLLGFGILFLQDIHPEGLIFEPWPSWWYFTHGRILLKKKKIPNNNE